ncbi:MAG: hypothetical protein ACXVA9_10345 [Bdellovibrionales bacterium]
MKNETLIAKAKAKAKRLAKLRRDPRYQTVMGRLVQDGLLDMRNVRRNKRKLWIDDMLWVGREIEPRVLQLMPAIALKRPGMLMTRDFPAALRAAMNDIKYGRDKTVFEGIPLNKCTQWVPEVGRKGKTPLASKTFRLSLDDQKILKHLSQKMGLTETEVLRVALRAIQK